MILHYSDTESLELDPKKHGGTHNSHTFSIHGTNIFSFDSFYQTSTANVTCKISVAPN